MGSACGKRRNRGDEKRPGSGERQLPYHLAAADILELHRRRRAVVEKPCLPELIEGQRDEVGVRRDAEPPRDFGSDFRFAPSALFEQLHHGRSGGIE